MRRLTLLLAFCALIGGATAQTPALSKEKLVIDFFDHEPNLPLMYVEMIRGEVRRGFEQRGRHIVLDAARVPGMRISQEILFNAPDPGLVERSRIDACRDYGARWLVWGDVTQSFSKHESIAGRVQFTTSARLTLSGMDLQTGETLTPEAFDLKGTGSDELDAKKRLATSIASRMESYIDRRYKFAAPILHIDHANDKGKYKDVYIGCGTSMGVHPGDLFMVYYIEQVDGLSIPHKIGKLRVKEVSGTTMSHCTISSGGEEIAAAMADGCTVYAESGGQALF